MHPGASKISTYSTTAWKPLVMQLFLPTLKPKAHRATIVAADVFPMPGGPLSSKAFFLRSFGLPPPLTLKLAGSSFCRWILSLSRH